MLFFNFYDLNTIAMPNTHLVLHIETLSNTLKNKTSIKHLIKIINLGAINCPVGRNGLRWREWVKVEECLEWSDETSHAEIALP